VQVLCNGDAWRLTARIHPALAPGIAGLPAGLPDMATITLPAWGVVRTATSGGPEK